MQFAWLGSVHSLYLAANWYVLLDMARSLYSLRYFMIFVRYKLALSPVCAGTHSLNRILSVRIKEISHSGFLECLFCLTKE